MTVNEVLFVNDLIWTTVFRGTWSNDSVFFRSFTTETQKIAFSIALVIGGVHIPSSFSSNHCISSWKIAVLQLTTGGWLHWLHWPPCLNVQLPIRNTYIYSLVQTTVFGHPWLKTIYIKLTVYSIKRLAVTSAGWLFWWSWPLSCNYRPNKPNQCEFKDNMTRMDGRTACWLPVAGTAGSSSWAMFQVGADPSRLTLPTHYPHPDLHGDRAPILLRRLPGHGQSAKRRRAKNSVWAPAVLVSVPAVIISVATSYKDRWPDQNSLNVV